MIFYMSYTACFHATMVAEKVIASSKQNGLSVAESTEFKEAIKTLIRHKAQSQIEAILSHMQSELEQEQLQAENYQQLIRFIAVNCRRNSLEINSLLIPPSHTEQSISESEFSKLTAPAA